MRKRFAVAGLFVASTVGVLAPFSWTQGTGVAATTAECATCCPQDGASCVICGDWKCVVHSGYYEGKMGPNGCAAEEN